MKKLFVSAVLLLASTQVNAEDFQINGQCSVYFSPKGGVTNALVKYIDSAKKSVHVLAYNFTSQPIGQALVRASRRGVDVQVIIDRSVPHAKNGLLPMMTMAHIITFIDSSHKIAHNKVIIVDGEWFETGSFNFSESAENSNGENALICHSPEGARVYLRNWMLHLSHSKLGVPDDD